jgi:hypothetical protein
MQPFSRVLFVFVMTLVCSGAFCQTGKPTVSPAETLSGMIGNAKITINYSSPSVKDRKIWGGLVPYDSVWRAGANEATTFRTDVTIEVAGKTLPAGRYSFFLVPRVAGPWTVIFNTLPYQWGAFKYDPTKDQLRVDVEPRMSADKVEALSYTIVPKGFLLSWEKMIVFIPVN